MTLAQICWSCSSEMHKLLDKVVSIWAMQHLCLCRLVFSLVTDVLFRSFSGIQETLQRLTAMIRGIGDPLVAVYARAYLCRVRRIILSDYILYFSRFSLQLWLFCYKMVFHALSWCIVDDKTSKNPVVSNWRSDPNHIIEDSSSLSFSQVGMEVAPHLKDSLNKNFFDLLASFRQIHGESVQKQLVLQRVEIPIYLTLYSPAIHWILQCVAYRAPEVHTYTPLRGNAWLIV